MSVVGASIVWDLGSWYGGASIEQGLRLNKSSGVVARCVASTATWLSGWDTETK